MKIWTKDLVKNVSEFRSSAKIVRCVVLQTFLRKDKVAISLRTNSLLRSKFRENLMLILSELFCTKSRKTHIIYGSTNLLKIFSFTLSTSGLSSTSLPYGTDQGALNLGSSMLLIPVHLLTLTRLCLLCNYAETPWMYKKILRRLKEKTYIFEAFFVLNFCT